MWLGIRRRSSGLRDVMIDFEARSLMTGDERTKSVGVSHFYSLVGLESATYVRTYVQVRSPRRCEMSKRTDGLAQFSKRTISSRDPLPPNY